MFTFWLPAGVVFHQAKARDVQHANGRSTLTCSDGTQLEAALVLDCTGDHRVQQLAGRPSVCQPKQLIFVPSTCTERSSGPEHKVGLRPKANSGMCLSCEVLPWLVQCSIQVWTPNQAASAVHWSLMLAGEVQQ